MRWQVVAPAQDAGQIVGWSEIVEISRAQGATLVLVPREGQTADLGYPAIYRRGGGRTQHATARGWGADLGLRLAGRVQPAPIWRPIL